MIITRFYNKLETIRTNERTSEKIEKRWNIFLSCWS